MNDLAGLDRHFLLFDKVNKILTQLNSNHLNPSKTIGEISLQPLGYVLFIKRLDDQFHCFDWNYAKSVNIETLTGQDIVDRINDNHPS